MIKREYANVVVTSGNSDTSEVSFSFIQEIRDLTIVNFEPEKKFEPVMDQFNVAAVAMTLENAKQFHAQLGDIINTMINQKRENENGEFVSGN